MSIPNNTKAIFSNLQNDFESATADQGLGSLGEWPDKGEHNCYVLGVNVSEGKFRQTGDGQEFPSISVQFHYQLCEDPDRAEPLIWKGAPMNIPNDPGQLSHEGSQIRARIEMGRLKGHLKTILSYDPSDIGAAFEEVENKLNGETTVAAVVRCQYTERNNRTYRTEFLQSLLGG
jgi:hypothetical protein